ncbi:hypothetical protein PFISCL1PPCAC_2147, partial [Pristionchus fissidentatus]
NILQLSISDDVAGATFMAAGGSAPEFFTSMFGVFVAQDNVGIGTIVGSATFNILCVLAFCTLFSREILQLTWWPLFRDMSFYIFALFLLVVFFSDEKVAWHEALSMLIVYILYGIFMKYNEQLENAVKSRLFKLPQITQADITASPRPIGLGTRSDSIRSSASYQRKSIPSQLLFQFIHGGAPSVRNGILSMAMAPTDDEDSSSPRSDEIAPSCNNNVRVIQVKPKNNTLTVKPTHSSISTVSSTVSEKNGLTPVESVKTNGLSVKSSSRYNEERPPMRNSNGHNGDENVERGANHSNGNSTRQRHSLEKAASVNSHDESPLDMSWPESLHKQIVYVILSPITFPLYLTLPDTRSVEMRKFFPITFVGSILWIALYSYLMVWWANVIGETLGIPTEIMGLTILAAGTSIPDLITSVIVARKGLGDMAVSSSIGSNLFDICVGLPIPWLIFFTIQFIKSPGSEIPMVSVSSNGLICSVGMLFMMLLVLVIGIALSSWQMDKFFGLVMIVSYIFFCILSILLETGHVFCPLKITPDYC